ncbi:hypothetical protein GCM10027040_04980 [Halomonas shantousis]
MGYRFWQRCYVWIVGDDQQPAHRMHHAFLMLGTSTLLLSALFNWLLNITPFIYNLLLLAMAACVGVMWYRSRWHGEYRRMVILFIQLLAFVILPINWLFNAGSQGPAIMFYLTSLAYALVLMADIGKQRLAVIAGLVAMPPLLLGFEQLQPQWISGYATPLSRLLDQTFCYLLSATLLGLLVAGHARRTHQEQSRAERYARQLEQLANRDSLTGLLNHRAIHQYAHDVIVRNEHCCLLICDLDHFKAINDRHGHPHGDKVLTTFAMLFEQIAHSCRAQAGRCGGEEFLGVIQAEPDMAVQLDRQLRQRLSQPGMIVSELTFSAGLAMVASGESLADALRRADQALYRAKAQGRNQLCFAKEAPDGTKGSSYPSAEPSASD